MAQVKKTNQKDRHAYTKNELKIRFKTAEGVELLKRYKDFIKKDDNGSINQISEDLMINMMKLYIGEAVGANQLFSEHVSDSMDKLSKTLSKSVKNQIDQISYEIQTNSLPMDLKLTLLMNLLADKDVIDAAKIDSPDPSLISDPLFSSKLKAKLASEHLNKEAKEKE